MVSQSKARLNNYQLERLIKSVKYHKQPDFTTVCILDCGTYDVEGTAKCKSELTYIRRTGERIAYMNALVQLRIKVNGS